MCPSAHTPSNLHLLAILTLQGYRRTLPHGRVPLLNLLERDLMSHYGHQYQLLLAGTSDKMNSGHVLIDAIKAHIHAWVLFAVKVVHALFPGSLLQSLYLL